MIKGVILDLDGVPVSTDMLHYQAWKWLSDQLGLTPGVCLVVEDADAGIQAAKAAGMRALGVGPAAQNPDADYSAASLAEPIDWTQVLGA